MVYLIKLLHQITAVILSPFLTPLGISYQVITSNHSAKDFCKTNNKGISYQVITSNHSLM